jgi:NMD protein affecting ribosome stability and mRNA decay
VALPQPEHSEHDPTVGGITPIPSLADAPSAGASRGAVWLTMCAWCGRLKVRGRWIGAPEVPELIDVSDAPEPTLTHGICPSCFAEVTAEAERHRGEPHER